MGRRHATRRTGAERDALIVEWRFLPRWVVTKMMGTTHPAIRRLGPEDAEGAGMFGLIRAAELWNETRGVLFKTYAVHCIWAQIQRHAVDQSVIHIPHYLTLKSHLAPADSVKAANKVRKLCSYSAGRMGRHMVDDRQADPQETAERLDLTAWLGKHLDRLPARTAEAIRLRYLDGLTLDAIGARLGRITTERVRQILKQGVEALRARGRILTKETR